MRSVTFSISPERRKIILDTILKDIVDKRAETFDKLRLVCKDNSELMFAGFAYGQTRNLLEAMLADESQNLRAWDFKGIVLENIHLRKHLDAGKALMQEFVDRVESGEVRSIKTYEKFKEYLGK